EAVQLRPEIDSLARWRVYQPWITDPSYEALRVKLSTWAYVQLTAAACDTPYQEGAQKNASRAGKP
ncbi:MAG: hypothetical protein WB509_32170, partial [Acetobacteraceae bacterium]